ncbi:MAG: hypothetical protein GWN71_17160, partial [Gammaproteobacteria bacterium]|nr:hypothetical protein [Gemmatimonadota bacterium]NIU75241.1 hypothetical protein [Gammaproteobacteria bacterium]
RDPELIAWFTDHARDLGQQFARPLLERQRAAAESPAASAYRPGTLEDDAARAADAVVDGTLAAYAELADRCVRV